MKYSVMGDVTNAIRHHQSNAGKLRGHAGGGCDVTLVLVLEAGAEDAVDVVRRVRDVLHTTPRLFVGNGQGVLPDDQDPADDEEAGTDEGHGHQDARACRRLQEIRSARFRIGCHGNGTSTCHGYEAPVSIQVLPYRSTKRLRRPMGGRVDGWVDE